MKSLLNIWTREIRATCFSLRHLQTFPRYEKKHFRFKLYKAERPRNIMLSELFYFCLVMLSLPLGILIFSFVYSCFFFQCKYRNYSSTEIQWIRDSGNESCSQERTNQVSQFRNESTAEGKLFITAISGIFVVSAQGTVHTSAEKFINATLAIYQMILDLWKLKTFEEKSHYYHDLIVYEKRRF